MPLPACFEVRNSVADCQANSVNHLLCSATAHLVFSGFKPSLRSDLSQPSAPSLPNWTTKTNSWSFCFKSFLPSVSHTWVKLWFAVHNHTTVSPTLPPHPHPGTVAGLIRLRTPSNKWAGETFHNKAETRPVYFIFTLMPFLIPTCLPAKCLSVYVYVHSGLF